MKVKIDLRLDIPGISKLKNRLESSTPALNDELKKAISESVVKLLDQNNKSFNLLVQERVQALEGSGVLKVKEDHKAGVYSTTNTFFNPEATVRYPTRKPAAEKVADAAPAATKATGKAKTAKEAAAAPAAATADAKFEL